MKRKIQIAMMVLAGTLTLFAFQNCGNNEADTGDVISELSSIDNSDLLEDEDQINELDEGDFQDFQVSRADSTIPAVNYMYTKSISTGYIHIRFRCPKNSAGTLYRSFNVFYNGRYWHNFTSGCRNSGNTRSIRFRGDWVNGSGRHEIRLVTRSRFEGNSNYSTGNKKECWSDLKETSCN